MVRSVTAVIAGSITWMVTALGTDVLLFSTHPEWFLEGGRVESVPVLLLMTAYSLGFSVLGGYVTGLLARREEARHALILGGVQLAMGIVASVVNFETAPLWWHASFLALLVPANVLGGRLRAAQRTRKAALSAA